MDLVQKIENYLLPLIEGTDIFIVKIAVKPINNIKIFLDADDGFPISKSTSINKKLRRQIDEDGLFPEGDYSLEVSSPGIDEPLVFKRQYLKNIGRKIEVTCNNGNIIEGTLTTVSDEDISVDVLLNPKKKDLTPTTIAFTEINKSVIQITF